MKHAHSLDCLIYNLWLRPPIFIDGQRFRSRRLRDVIRGYDVVVLCEVFNHRAKRRLFEALRDEYPFQTDVIGVFENGGGFCLTNGGVACLSRWPIEKIDVRFFRGHLAPPDSYADKGVLYCRINKEGLPYHIFGAHSQASPEAFMMPLLNILYKDVEGQFASNRLKTYHIIRNFIEDLHISKYEPVLILGDMNVDRHKEYKDYCAMLEILDAASPEIINHHLFTFDPLSNPLASGAPCWLDYVLYSKTHLQPSSCFLDVQEGKIDEEWHRFAWGRKYNHLSDHFAVAGKFVF